MNLVLRIPTRLRRLVARRGAPRLGRRRAAVVALVAFPLAFAALHLAFVAAARSPLVFDPYYGDKERTLAALERANPGPPRVVALGSSRTFGAFDARRASDATGATAFNFGAPGAGPVTQLVYLRRLLADGHTPDVVLLEVLPSLFAADPVMPPEAPLLTPDRLSPAESELAVARYDFPEAWVRLKRAEADRWPWGAHAAKLLARADARGVPSASRMDQGRETDAHGWGPPPADHAPTADGFERAVRQYGAALRDWSPCPAAVRALRDALALCRDRRIPVALVLMPESAAFRALHIAPGPQRLNAMLADACAEFACPLIDARGWLSDDQFSDGHHQLQIGARPFTDRLTAEALIPLLRERGPR